MISDPLTARRFRATFCTDLNRFYGGVSAASVGREGGAATVLLFMAAVITAGSTDHRVAVDLSRVTHAVNPRFLGCHSDSGCKARHSSKSCIHVW